MKYAILSLSFTWALCAQVLIPSDPERHAGGAGGAWADSNYQRRVSVTIQSSQVGSTLTDFPLFIDPTELPAGFAANVEADGDDVRIYADDHATLLDIEMVDVTKDFYTRVPSVSATVDTEVWVYYDYASATAYGTPEDVWDADYVMVQHMDGATFTDLDDSSSTGSDVTGQSGSPTYAVTGVAGDAVTFSGSGEYVTVPDATALDLEITDTFSLEMWIKTAQASTRGMLCKWNGTDGWHTFLYSTGGKERATFQFSDGAAYRFRYGQTDLSDDVWHYLVFTYDGSNTQAGMKIYVDGAEETYNDGSSGTITQVANADVVVIGARLGGTPLYFDGEIDGVRITTATLTSDRISSAYTNINAFTTFCVVGTEETQ